jgi:hypothetical protein
MLFRGAGAVLAASACLALSACSAVRDVPMGRAASQSSGSANTTTLNARLKLQPQEKSYGVGLSGTAGLIDGTRVVQHFYCQQKKYRNGCPQTKDRLRSAQFFYSKKIGNDDGSFSLDQSGSSALGSASYDQSATATSTDQSDASEGVSGEIAFAWSDTLHIVSSKLPNGTPVTINVALSVSPGTINVDCGSELSQGDVEISGTGVDANGYSIALSGGCSTGSPQNFTYFLPNGQPGTTETGTLTSAVGQSLVFDGAGTVFNVVCESYGGTCDGSFTSALSAGVSWQITGITAGASYRSDSGMRYN